MPAPLYLLVHFTIALGVGWLFLAKFDTASRLHLGERLILAPLFGILFFYFAIQGVGLVRLDTWSMLAVLVVLGGIAAAGLRSMPWTVISVRLYAVASSIRTQPRLAVLIIVFCGIAVTSLLQGMAPPNDYDSLMYQITGPRFDVELGRLGMPWDRQLGHFLFPALIGHQTRIALVLSNAGAAQMISGALGIFAGAITALLLRRLGYSRFVATIGALLYISTRVVVWEMGTVEVEVPLSAFAGAALLLYLVLRDDPNIRLAILFGIAVGEMLLTKFHGFALALAFGPVILHDIWRTRRLAVFAVGPVVAVILFLPHAVRVFRITGNPIFPIFNQLFGAGRLDLFSEAYSAYGVGGGLAAILTTPWFMFVEPMKYFDGMIFGFPLLLMFVPLALLEGKSTKKWIWLLTFALAYYAIWYVAFGQQARFLLPLLPILCGIAAVGIVTMWQSISNMRIVPYGFIALLCVAALGQAMFVGIYSVLRLPVALGLISPLDYHRNTPTLGGAHYESCVYIEANLKPGESYFSLLSPLSYYCPQRSAVVLYFEDEAKWWLTSRTPPEMSFGEFLKRYEKADFRFVLLPEAWVSRRNISAEEHRIEIDPNSLRFGSQLFSAAAALRPLATDELSAVYDGRDLLSELRRQKPDQSDREDGSL